MTEKHCRFCNITKDINDFHRDYSRSDYRNPRCKLCWKLYMSEPRRVAQATERVKTYAEHPRWIARKNEYQRKYREKKKLEKELWRAEHDKLKQG